MDDSIEDIELNPANARRTFTLRNNIARQVAVNFMPSRQIPHNSLRLRRVNSEHNALLDAIADSPDAVDRQADIIVREMEQHSRLMYDNPLSQDLRREALRDLPQCLTMKRTVRAKLSASVSMRSQQRVISVRKQTMYRISFAWKRMRDRFSNMIFSIELWYEAIRVIEGHLGSAVGSYFHLLQWLFGVNVLLTIFVVSFLVIPQIVYDNRQSETGTSKGVSFFDVISGMGGLEDTVLFYGHYHNGGILGDTEGYNIPYAYFFTMFVLYLLIFTVLGFRTAYSYRRNFIETSGGLHQVFASKVFCGWDFSIVSHHAAQLNASSLYNEFKELLTEQNKKHTTPSTCVRFGQKLANLTVTTVVIGVIMSLQYGLWWLLSVYSTTEHWELVVSLAVTAVLGSSPLLLNFVVRLEFYKPRTAFYVTLARTWLLDFSTFLLLFVFWARSKNKCWETSFGQEMYRLVVFDALVSLFLIPTIEIARGLIYKYHCNGSAPEFNIAYNSLTLIYNQSVLWFGMLFSPLLVLAVTVKFLLLFYVKKETALRMCHPTRKVWRAAQTQTMLLVLVTLSLFATLFAVGTIFLSSSPQCGVFSRYAPVWQLLTEDVLGLSHHRMLKRSLHFVTRPGSIAFLLLALCVAVYFARAKSIAQRSMVTILRQMLVLQAQDKDFLLSAIDKVSNGEWMYSPRPADEGPDTYTWRYVRDVRKPSNAGYQLDVSRVSRAFSDRARSGKDRPASDTLRSQEDGDTDSSFSWQGSSNCLNRNTDRSGENTSLQFDATETK